MDIGLIGKAGSGKDAAAQHLCEAHGYARIAFADPVREMALRIDPIVYADEHINALYESEIRSYRLSGLVQWIGWDRAKIEFPEVRRLLQQMGQTVRKYDPDFWVRRALNAYSTAWPDPVVVTDVRYRNEAEALRTAGFTLVRIVRPGAGLSGSAGQHDSETELGSYPADITITNDGSLADLHDKLDKIIRA